MSYQVSAITTICGWQQNDKIAKHNWLHMSPDQVLRRVARHAGVTTKEVLGCQNDQQALVERTTEYLCGDVCNPSDIIKAKHFRIYAALWAFLMPDEEKRPRSDSKWVWNLQFRVGICTSIYALPEMRQRPHL